MDQTTLTRKIFPIDSIKSINEDDLTLTAVITDSSLDRDNEIISTKGIQTDNFMKNPVVLYSHNRVGPFEFTNDLPVGKVLSLKKMAKKMEAKVKFTPEDLHPDGYKLFRMYKEGFLRAFSIGYKEIKSSIKEVGDTVIKVLDKIDLAELSVAIIPANPNAIAKSLTLPADSVIKDNMKLKDEVNQMPDNIKDNQVDENTTDETENVETLTPAGGAGDTNPEKTGNSGAADDTTDEDQGDSDEGEAEIRPRIPGKSTDTKGSSDSGALFSAVAATLTNSLIESGYLLPAQKLHFDTVIGSIKGSTAERIDAMNSVVDLIKSGKPQIRLNNSEGTSEFLGNNLTKEQKMAMFAKQAGMSVKEVEDLASTSRFVRAELQAM